MAFEGLELLAWKLARAVLRGLGAGDSPWLLGAYKKGEYHNENTSHFKIQRNQRTYDCSCMYGYPDNRLRIDNTN